MGIRCQWSDGMWNFEDPSHCRLSRCPHCGFNFWTEDAESRKGESPTYFARLSWDDVVERPNPAYEGHPALLPSRNEDAIAALEGDLPEDRAHYLRRALWWRCNHPHRGIETDFGQPIPVPVRESLLRRLLALEEAKPNEDRDVVVEAELMRELGDFEAALARMAIALRGGSTRAFSIHAQASAGNPRVCIVREDDSAIIY